MAHDGQYAHLPSVDALADALDLRDVLPRGVVIACARDAITRARDQIAQDEQADPHAIAAQLIDDVIASVPRRVINATGVLLHTNLGRAPLHRETAAAVATLQASAGNVEIDLRTGRRAQRSSYINSLLRVVTGAEAGFAVNNNAGALLLALAAVAGNGGRVAVSRGELIEIGGSFRLPELMEASGATLVEVGTTNRTRVADYAAIAGSVDAILKVHPSNYRVEGFHEDASYEEIATLARDVGIPFIADVGSGLIDETAPWLGSDLGSGTRAWLADEPGVRQVVTHGADLVIFSGDKLLGGPQAGILAGTEAAVSRASRHPIARAVRLDGPSLGAVSAILEMYANQQVLAIPFWAMASASVQAVDERAHEVIDGTSGCIVVDGESVPGAGSVPGSTIPTRLIVVPGSAEAVWKGLVAHEIPVVASRTDNRATIDLRSVLPSDDEHVAAAVRAVLA